jgi:hypothetical protein
MALRFNFTDTHPCSSTLFTEAWLGSKHFIHTCSQKIRLSYLTMTESEAFWFQQSCNTCLSSLDTLLPTLHIIELLSMLAILTAYSCHSLATGISCHKVIKCCSPQYGSCLLFFCDKSLYNLHALTPQGNNIHY